MAGQVFEALTDEQIASCHRVVVELRPHLATPEDLVERVQRQRVDGYRFAYSCESDGPVAVVGFRRSQSLAWGRHIYVDDLVTLTRCRGKGYGERLICWVIDRAEASGCEAVHLDSGVQRFSAHRFYLRHGFDIRSHHFVRIIGS